VTCLAMPTNTLAWCTVMDKLRDRLREVAVTNATVMIFGMANATAIC
jgi:hypothetical protein